jgi:hypothetical protein
MAAKGEALDWNAYIPPGVAADQNVFAAPHMTEWFVSRATNDLIRRFDPQRLYEFTLDSHTNVIAEITVVSPGDRIVPTNADLVLYYSPPMLMRACHSTNDPLFVIIPLIVMDEVPLCDAIKNLAHEAKLNYMIDPKVYADPKWKETYVSGRWTDTTALSVIFALLNNYGLQWVDDPNNGFARITANPSGRSSIYVDPAVSEPLHRLIQNVLDADGLDAAEPSVRSFEGFELVVHPVHSTARPVRLVLQADKQPDLKELAKFFLWGPMISGGHQAGIRLEPDGKGFCIVRSPPPYTAAEYLAWSDQFEPDFRALRDALKRPYSRMEGNYEDPETVPWLSYRAFRAVTHTLAQRAQCHLLLGQPEAALEELTLIHDACRLLEYQHGKPVGLGLVAGMIEARMLKVYVHMISEGLRQHAWSEPQLVRIQEQLKDIDLLPLLAQGMRMERASQLRTIELAIGSNPPNLPEAWEKHDFTRYRFLKVPRGWVYQNFVRMSDLGQMTIDSVDLTNHTIRVDGVNQFDQETQHDQDHPRPYRYISVTVPDYIRATQEAAHTQAMADQARIACALERYHVANGNYPETLGALVPLFLRRVPQDIISGQPMKYQRKDRETFELYSVGWNKTDDGGACELKSDGSIKLTKGDWTWPPRWD